MGEVVRMVELGRDAKQAALDAEAACSVKVVAGARLSLRRTFRRALPLGRRASRTERATLSGCY